MIYIDPPYNTGKDFIYKDNFVVENGQWKMDSGEYDEEGNRLVANTESHGRFHSDWLSMMYPRLKLARNLLRDDGVIFISIDDGEQANLKRMCDEIFGADNFLGTIIWKKKTNGNNVGYISPVHDYFLSYGKSVSDDSLLGVPLSEEFITKTYSNPDNDPRGHWATSDLSANHIGPYFEIKNPKTGDIFLPPKGRYWVFGEAEVKKRIKDGRILFGKFDTGRPIQKKFLNERASMRRKVESWWDSHGMNRDGTSEISELIATKAFTHPKPSITLRHLCNTCTQDSDLILDFFAGSATTAHAVMQLNAEDGGKRKFIMVQLPEPCNEKSEAFKAGYKTIAEISKERIRRAGLSILEKLKLKNENEAQNSPRLFDAEKNAPSSPLPSPLDRGFRVLKVDSSNMAKVYYTPDTVKQDRLDLQTENIKSDRSPEDLLFQILLDWGLDLSLHINKETLAEREVFFVDDNALAACFEKEGDITEDFCKELAKRQPLRVVFRDAGFKNDSVKINVEEIFKLLSPHTDIKTI